MDTIRRLRLARLILRRNRVRLLSLQECFDAAIEIIHERDVQVARLRAEVAELRDEQRRFLAAQVSHL